MVMAMLTAWTVAAGAAPLAKADGGALEAFVPASPITFTPGAWNNPPTDPAALKGPSKMTATLDAGGWYTTGGQPFGLYPPMTDGVNQGIRARFKYVTGGTADVTVRRRVDANGTIHSYCLRLDETGTLRVVDYSNVPAVNKIERKSLLTPEKKLAVQKGDEVLLELIAVGDQLVAKVNGQVFGRVDGVDAMPGKVSTYTVGMTAAGLQWLDLDGIPERKAKAAVAITTSAMAPAKTADGMAKPVFVAPPLLTSDPDVRQRVAEIDTKFRAFFDQLAGNAYKSGVELLNQNYLAALKREEAKAQQKGSLKDVLMFQNEAKRVTDAGPRTSEQEIPGPLVPMHETYRKAMTKLEADRDRLSAPAYEAYAKALGQYIAELTKAGRIEAAKQVDGVREALQQSGEEPASTQSKPGAAPES